MKYLVFLSFAGLALLAVGNQSVAAVMTREQPGNHGPMDSVIYAFKQPRKCLRGVAMMILGVVLMVLSSVLPLFLFRGQG